MTIRHGTWFSLLVTSLAAIGCSGTDGLSSGNSPQTTAAAGVAGYGGGAAGREAVGGPMAGLGTMMLMAGTGSPNAESAGAIAGAAGLGGGGGQAGSALAGAAAPPSGTA